MMNTNPENNTTNDSRNQEYDRADCWERRHEWRREMREARRREPWHGLFFALLLILVGGLFLAEQMGGIPGDMFWKYLLVGLGSIFIIDGLVHFSHPEWYHGGYGKIVFGLILAAIGILFIADFAAWWPIVLIVAGCALIFGLFLRRA